MKRERGKLGMTPTWVVGVWGYQREANEPGRSIEDGRWNPGSGFRETQRGTSTDVTFSADLAAAEDWVWVWVWAGKLASHGSSEPPSGVSCPQPRQLGAGMGVAVLQVGAGPACKPPDSAGQDCQNSPSGALSAARTSPERASVDSRGRV